jgi:hypothetical protein
MTSTTIVSEGAVYLAGKKTFAKDRFHVFDRSVSFGRELPDGTVADRNYVWLSEWQLENINSNHVLPIDFEAYKRLKNHIAKALVPLLQIWLYATRADGLFEKRYDELCQVLNVSQYHQISRIKEQFAVSLDELTTHAYLSDWTIEKTADRKSYKIIFYHGEKFHQDRRKRLASRDQAKTRQTRQHLGQGSADLPPEQQHLVAEMTKRGIAENRARKLLENLADSQQVVDQLEWGDYLLASEPGKFKNPPGFFIHLIQENILVPDTFETSSQKQLKVAAGRQALDRVRLEQAYQEYRSQEIDRFIQHDLSELDYQQLEAAKLADLEKQNPFIAVWPADKREPYVRGAVRGEIAKRIAFTTFEAFCAEQQTILAQPVAAQGTEAPPSDNDRYLVV